MTGKKAMWLGSLVVAIGLLALAVRWYQHRAPEPHRAEGVTGDVNWIIPPAEIGQFKQRALRGDGRAAESLANHYAALRQPDQERHWLTVAARAGNCNAMDLLEEVAVRSGDAAAVRRWAQQRRRSCPGRR